MKLRCVGSVNGSKCGYEKGLNLVKGQNLGDAIVSSGIITTDGKAVCPCCGKDLKLGI